MLTDFIGKYLPYGGRVLDIGCGDGWLALSLPLSEWYGIEPDKGLREIAAMRGVKVMPGGVEDLPFPDGSFDSVAMFDVLEHVVDDREAMEEARRILKPGGLLFASVPLHPELWSKHDISCRHIKRYRKGEVQSVLKKVGFTVLNRRFFVSLPLPAVFLARRQGSGKMPVLPPALDRALCKCLMFDVQLGLPFGLTEVVVALED